MTTCKGREEGEPYQTIRTVLSRKVDGKLDQLLAETHRGHPGGHKQCQ